LESPKLEPAEGGLRLSGPGKGRLGVELLGNCQSAAEWTGTLRLTLAPRIDESGRLRVRVLDSRLDDVREGAASNAALAWELARPHVHERLERFGYDLGASRDALAAVLKSAVPPEQAAAMQAVVDALEVQQPRVEAAHVVVPVAFEIPQAWTIAPPASAASTAPLGE